MMNTDIFDRVRKVFCEVFDDEKLVVTETTNSEDIEDWDSLEHINLVIGIEAEFQIKFNISEVNSFKNVGEMADAIEQKLK